MSSQGRPPGRRTRGTSAGLDPEAIIEAARSLDPDAVTMQAVANVLGVDRKALNHHVSDRETLLALVALDAFAENFSAVHITAEGTWTDACRTYALGFTEAVIAAGALADHLRPRDAPVTTMLSSTEALLARLVQAGFDDSTAVRLLALLTNICHSFARDAVFASRTGTRPRPLMLRESLKGQEEAFPHLARIAAEPTDTYDVQQLWLCIEVFLRGAESLLSAQSTP